MSRLSRINGRAKGVASCGLKEGCHIRGIPKAVVSTKTSSDLVGLRYKKFGHHHGCSWIAFAGGGVRQQSDCVGAAVYLPMTLRRRSCSRLKSQSRSLVALYADVLEVGSTCATGGVELN
jgi:hypothetical protein